MALFPKTPGVYIQEVSTLPPSVVPVPTAIPVFIGYTEQAVIDGEDWDFIPAPLTYNPTDPVRIESFLQFQTIFGGAFSESFDVTLTGSNVDISIDFTSPTEPRFRMYYDMQMYFANGGGTCYVISLGIYSGTTSISASHMISGIDKAAKADDITLIVIPEAMSLTTPSSLNSDRKNVYDAALAQCAKLQNRFAIMDVEVVHGSPASNDTIKHDSDVFRNFSVGANNLNYGAAYYPSFQPGFGFTYLDTDISIDATDGSLPADILAYGNTHKLADIKTGIKATGSITVAASFSDSDKLKINGIPVANPAITIPTAAFLTTTINSNPSLNAIVKASYPGTGTVVTITAVAPGPDGNYTIAYTGSGSVTTTSMTGGILPNTVVYNNITAQLAAFPLELYPSAMMAGIYASVDNSRGVWKAPANVGFTEITFLNRNITDADQSGLNVDPMSGKSIDALRVFPGRGGLVWGARTLDGNSNDFRYVNVRRTLIFIENSCKKATEFVVFEPNDKNTWIRVKGMISNFLTNLWRDGGLVGTKPEQAFTVSVGLGETMTSDDILEGRMIVSIGVAISHPAEFVIIEFMHKLQVS